MPVNKSFVFIFKVYCMKKQSCHIQLSRYYKNERASFPTGKNAL